MKSYRFLILVSAVLVASDHLQNDTKKLIQQGLDLMAQEKYSDSRPYFEQAKQLDPDNLQIHLGYWRSFFYESNEQEALKVLEQAQVIADGEDVDQVLRMEYWWALGYTHQYLGHQEQARQILQKVIDAQTIESKEYWHTKGRAYMRLGQLEKAVPCLQRASDMLPKGQPIEQAKILASLGHAHIVLKDYAQAEGCLRAAVAKNPNISQYYDSLGTALRKLKRIEEAKECYEQALNKNPNLLHAKSNLALCWHKSGDTDRALSLLQETLKVDFEHYEANYRLAKIYCDLAIEHAEKALKASNVGSIVDQNKIKQLMAKLL